MYPLKRKHRAPFYECAAHILQDCGNQSNCRAFKKQMKRKCSPVKKRYLWLPLLILVFILMQTLPALCENTDAAYVGPTLVFNAPRDAELTSTESTIDSYFETLYCPGQSETIMSGAFPSTEAAEEKLISLFGDTASSGAVNDALDAVSGYAARWTAFTAGSGDNVAYVNAVVIDGPRAFVFAAVAPLKSYRGDDNGEAYSDLVYEQIMSLNLFDPNEKLAIDMENEDSAAFSQPAANIVIDEESSAFRLTALSDLTAVKLVNVRSDEEGRLSAGDTLGEWPLLKAGEYLRIQAYFPEIIPTLAIEYTTAEGESCLRFITDSKLDGTPMLIEQ